MSDSPRVIDGLDWAQLTGHLVSMGAIVGTIVGLIPALAALAAVIWYVIAIWETKTVQGWLHHRRLKKRGRTGILTPQRKGN